MILVTPFMDDRFLVATMEFRDSWIMNSPNFGECQARWSHSQGIQILCERSVQFSTKKNTFLKFWVDYIRIRHIFGLCLSPLKLKFFIWVIFPIRGDESQTMVNRILNQRKSCFSSKILFFHEIIILFSVKFIFNTFNVLLLILSKIQKNAFLNPGFRKLRKPEFFNMIPL